MPIEYFVLTRVRSEGAIVGYVGDKPIWEIVVDSTEARYRFVGIAPRDCDGRLNVNLLKQGEWIVEPGLIYLADAGQSL